MLGQEPMKYKIEIHSDKDYIIMWIDCDEMYLTTLKAQNLIPTRLPL